MNKIANYQILVEVSKYPYSGIINENKDFFSE